jgi:leader peptidase (prepilin peptidase)/N-methyltransferase
MPGLSVAIIVGLGVLGWLVGLVIRRNLNHFSYRIIGPHDDERERPHPGSRWWVPIALSLAWLALGAAYAHNGWPWLALWLPYAGAGVWLAAVDFDVHRLPDKVQAPLGIYSLGIGIGLIIMGYGHWISAVTGVIVCAGVFGVVHVIGRRAMGFGDVKQVAIVGWCLGLVGWTHILYGLLIASLFGIGWGLIRREREFAFGPWLVFGTVVAASIAGISWTTSVSVSLR